MNKRNVMEAIQYARHQTGDGLKYFKRHYPFLFALAAVAGVTLLAIGFAAGYGELAKAAYGLVLERVLNFTFGESKAVAAKVVGEAVEDVSKEI